MRPTGPLKGTMNIRAFLPFSRTAGPAPQDRRSDSETQSSAQSSNGPAQFLRKALAVGLSVLLVPATGGELFAQAQQVPPPPPPDSEQSAPAPPQQQYDTQNPVVPDPNYVPPSSGQQPYYPQQQYSQEQAPPPPDANQAYAQGYSDQGYGDGTPVPAQSLNPDQLDQMVAPIALYPDSLLAEVLAASTYPAQVVDADHWRQSQGNAAPQQIAAGADVQNWDPSVKSLTAFPQVLDMMAQNLQWTTQLGNAYYNQPQDVTDAVQAMRQRAQAAGTLQSTPQLNVEDDQGYIDLAPANPQVVYVPEYNPWVVYGAPVAPYAGFYAPDYAADLAWGVIGFGVGVALTAFTGLGWAFGGWGFNWGDHCVLYHGGGWYTHSREVRDWGFAHGGPRAAGWHGGGMYHGGYGYRDRAFGGGRPGASFGNRGGYMGGRGGFHEYGAGPARMQAERAQEGRGYGNSFHGTYGTGRGGFNGGSRTPGFGSNGRNQAFGGGYGRNQAYGGGYGRTAPFSGNRPQPSIGNRGSFGNGYGRSYGGSQTIARNGGFGAGRGSEMSGYRQFPQTGRGYGQSYGGFGQAPRAPQQTYRGYSQPSRGGSMVGGGMGGRAGGGFPGYAAPRSYGGGGSRSYGGGGRAFGGGNPFGGGGRSFGGGGNHSFGGGGGHSFGGGGGHSFGGGGGHSFGGGGGHSGGGGGGHFGGGGHGGGGGHHR